MKSSSVDFIVADKKTAEHFILIFAIRGQYFGREYADAPMYKARDASISVCPITEKGSQDILKQINPHKPTGPCKVPAWTISDG